MESNKTSRRSRAFWVKLILVLAVLPIALASWWVAQARSRSAELEAKAAIEKLGGLPVLDNRRTHVATLNLQLIKDPSAIKQAMQHVASLPHLQVLDLSQTPVSDEDLAAVRKLKRLNSLHLNDTPVTSTGVEHLVSQSQLEGLHVAGTQIDARALASIGRLTNLMQLDLSRTDVADGLASLDPLDRLVWLVAVDLPLERSHAEALLKLDALKRITLGADQLESPLAEALLAGKPNLTVD